MDVEIDRILGSRDFESSYGRAEWLSEDQPIKIAELDSGDYKKLVVCLSDGSSVDLSDKVTKSKLDLSCAKDEGNGISVTENCGLITINSDIGITSIKGLYKLPRSEAMKWLLEEHSSMLISYLEWRLKADIDAKSSGVAYNVYARALANVAKAEVITL